MSLLKIIEIIESERIKQKLTRSELCRQAGVNLNTWYKIRKGNTTPNIVTLSLLLDVLNLEVIVKRRNA
jgi:transcriptional regulator with XRE-family HTH domain